MQNTFDDETFSGISTTLSKEILLLDYRYSQSFIISQESNPSNKHINCQVSMCNVMPFGTQEKQLSCLSKTKIHASMNSLVLNFPVKVNNVSPLGTQLR